MKRFPHKRVSSTASVVHIPKYAIVPRHSHIISRSHIHRSALTVMSELEKQGFQAYLVGGCVRDLLMGIVPKDFDIVTNAFPEQVARVFSRAKIIGRRFKIVHVYMHHQLIEVSTFRSSVVTSEVSDSGMLLNDNDYASDVTEDYIRRDFTINALYYNLRDFSIYDFAGGIGDISKKQIVILGDPIVRYKEDPVRMLRAIRFSAQFDFIIEKDTSSGILSCNDLLSFVSPARLYDESLKIFRPGIGSKVYHMLENYHLFLSMYPLSKDEDAQFLRDMFLVFDQEETNDLHAQVFLYAFLLWMPFVRQLEKRLKKSSGQDFYNDYFNAMEDVFHQQLKLMLIPRRILSLIKDFWLLQYRLERRKHKRIRQNPFFKKGKQFLKIRGRYDVALEPILNYWKI